MCSFFALCLFPLLALNPLSTGSGQLPTGGRKAFNNRAAAVVAANSRVQTIELNAHKIRINSHVSFGQLAGRLVGSSANRVAIELAHWPCASVSEISFETVGEGEPRKLFTVALFLRLLLSLLLLLHFTFDPLSEMLSTFRLLSS